MSPAVAVSNITSAFISYCLLMILWIAKYTKTPVRTQIKRTDTTAPITSTNTENERKLVQLYYNAALFSKVPKTFRARKAIRETGTQSWSFHMLQSFVHRDALPLKIQRELCHPKLARKVWWLSWNGPMWIGVWSINWWYEKILTRTNAHMAYLIATKLRL